MSIADDDSDFTHLCDLLRMLPGPRESSTFWAEIAEYTATGTEVRYVFEKLSSIPRAVQEPTPAHIEYLARYLLFFFAGDKPALWRTLNAVTNDTVSVTNDDVGRWWAEDVCRTAWALYVRYNQTVDTQWLGKWQFHTTLDEWLPNTNPE
jgi:hypothetical protein